MKFRRLAPSVPVLLAAWLSVVSVSRADVQPTPRAVYSITYGDATPSPAVSGHFVPGMPRHFGTVYSVSQWRVQFTDARSILLSKYTVVDPVGGVIRKGQHLLVQGYYSPASKPGAPVIDARSIVILNGDGQDH